MKFERSDHVSIRGLRGTWVAITVNAGSFCSVTDCDIKGGNDALGTIQFISGDADSSWGHHNRIARNTVRNGANR